MASAHPQEVDVSPAVSKAIVDAFKRAFKDGVVTPQEDKALNDLRAAAGLAVLKHSTELDAGTDHPHHGLDRIGSKQIIDAAHKVGRTK